MEKARTFESQVGGHMKILATADEGIILKPCVTVEREFYELSQNYPELLPFLADFMGTLSSSQDTQISIENEVSFYHPDQLQPLSNNTEPDFICLENLLLPYKNPSILDLKIGTKLYDHLASEEKKARMILKAQETTSLKLGIRFTGMKVYDHIEGAYKIFDREYGVSLTEDTIFSAFESFIPSSLPIKLRIELVTDFIESLVDFINVLEKLPVRMTASSLLFIYEGNLPSLENKIAAYNQYITNYDCSSEAQETSENESESETIPIPPTNLKLIDFAHSYFIKESIASSDRERALPADTQGPDVDCILGATTALSYLSLLREKLTGCVN